MRHLRLLILITALVLPLGKLRAGELIWKGKNNARWSELSSWKNTVSNNSSDHLPGQRDRVIFPAGTSARIHLEQDVEIGEMVVEKGARVEFISLKPITWTIHGTLNFEEKVNFVEVQHFRFGNKVPSFLHTSGTQFTGDLVFTGRSLFEITDDVHTQKNFVLDGQDIFFKGKFIAAHKLNVTAKNSSKFNGAKLILSDPNIDHAEFLRDNSYEVLNGDTKSIGGGQPLNPCGTIPFFLTATATSDYNGFDVSCNGSSDATICVNVVGGVGPFNYTWVGGPNTPCYSGVDAGNYIVVVFDMGQGGVSCFTTVVVNEPTEMTLLSWTGTNPSCFEVCDGSAAPVIVGGVPAYSYLWSTGETTPVATQLCNGANTVTVTDANGCVFDTTFFVLIPTQVDPNLTAYPTSCFGVCDGAVVSNVTGGNGAPYTYTWSSTPANVDSIGGLCPGTYTIIVEDNAGCLGYDTIDVTQPVSISVITTSVTNLVCNGVCSGSITVSISNGTPPYTLQWFNATTGVPIPGATGTTISGLCAGSYYVVVNDAGSCTFQSINFTITQPPAINVTVNGTNIDCNGACNGVLSATLSGGTPTLSVTWFNAATSLSVGTGNPLGGMCAGTYFAQVTDGNGCIQLSSLVTLTEPLPLNLSVSSNNILCSGSCTGTATATVSGGTGTLTVTWHQSPSGTLIGSGTTINALCAGNYFATLTDGNGCSINSPVFSITEPSPLAISSQGNTDVTCNGACDGTAFFNVTGGTVPITITWFQNPGAVPIGQTGDTAVNLCPGTYFAEAVDANGCSIQSANHIVTQPLPVNINVTSVSSQCGTTCDGSASASVSGGTPSYTFTWVDSTTNTALPDTASPVNNLCAGTYFVVVTDQNNCRDTSAYFEIMATIIVDGSVTGIDVTCSGFCNGVADLAPAGGIPPYTYEWFDQTTGSPIGQSSEDANGLCAGSYFVIVTDSTLCNSIPLSVVINEPAPINVTATPQDVTCFNACNGQITGTVNGGTPGYTFLWFNAVTGMPTTQTTLTATGLCAGSYYLQVTDANGCQVNSATVTINQPPQITFSVSTTPVTCFGACNGTATLVVAGGIGPYTITWSTSANTTQNETGICAGTHSFTITDANGCSRGPFNFTINSPTSVTANVNNGTIACNGDCNGVASVNVSGGTAPYTYQWDAAAGSQTTPVATGLCDGSFDVTVQDANGCSYGPFTATITDPNTLSASISASTNTTCAPGCSGTATVSISGGTAPYSVLWDDPLAQTTLTAIQLCAGIHTVTVTDANGCSTSVNVNIGTTTGPSVTVVSSNTACSGTCVGTASATVTGGTAPVLISWSTGATSANISALCEGTYTVTVTDALGCTDVASVNISETTTPIAASVSSTLTACSSCNGTATVTPSGGSGTYTFQWDAAAGSQTTATAGTLCAGVYTVTVTDVVSGCTGNFTAAVSNAGAETINVDSTATSCNNLCTGTATVSFVCNDAPCSVLWNDPAGQTTPTATGLCAGTYGVTVTNASGCIAAATIEVTEPDPIEVGIASTDALCNGVCNGQAAAAPTGGNGIYTYSWNDPLAQTAFTAFNLCPGNYIVTVTDSSGCTGQDTAVIDEPTPINLTVSSSDATCPGACNGTGTVFPTGGVFPYTFSWDNSQTTQVATGLCAGTFTVTVFDANNCTAGPQSVTINEPVAATVTITSTNPVCGGQCNGTATANVTGGTAPYTYLWNDPAGQTTQTATNLCPGNYDVTVTDANGCVLGTASITITSVPNLVVSVSPSGVTCNGLCDAQLIASITGGTAPYGALWSNAQTNAIATALCPGNYSVVITDANGCTASATQTVGEPAPITSGLVVNDIACNGTCTGTASVTPSGGAGGYTVLWSPGGQSTSSVSGLCAGNYLVSLSDSLGCNVQTNFQVNEPPVFTLLTGTSPALCGVCDGSASVSPVGGTPPYTYQWDAAAASQTTQVALNLCAGIYGASVTDQNGCTLSTNIPVSNIDGESLTVTPVDATCPDACDGSATATTACVNGPCTFAWFEVSTGASMSVATSNISGLCPGEYIARVINAANCTTLVQFTVGSPDTIEVVETITNPLCNASCTGVISVSATGGTGMLSFQWDAAAGGGTGNTVNGLCSGSYDLIVTDAAGCDDTLTYTITPPLPVVVNVNNSSTLCSGTCTGTATAIVAGGVPPYTYAWSDAQTTSTASGLCNGSFSVTVTDANGCTGSSGAVVVSQPAALTATTGFTPTVCSGDCNGTATVSIAGGTAPFVIQWDDPLNQTTTTATGLCAQTYTVTVTDANNCSDGPETVTLTAPGSVSATFSVTDVSCNGLCTGVITINATGGDGAYIYSIDNGVTFQTSNVFSNLCAGSYQVIIEDGSACASAVLPVNVNEPTVLDATTSSLNADCGTNNGAATVFPVGGTPGYTINWFDFALNPLGQTTPTAINLSAGIYTAFVQDNNGCEFEISVTVSNNDAPSATAVLTQPNCNGDCDGAIDVTVTSGVAPFFYEWLPTGQTNQDISNVCAGTYILQITDNPGCISFNTFTLTEPAPFSNNVTTTDATCGQCNGSAVANITGGTGALSLVWSNLQTGSTANGLCGGAYSVLVTDANGCDEQFNVTISNTSAPTPVVSITNPVCFNSCTGAATVSASGGVAPYTFLWLETGSTSAAASNLCPGSYTVEVKDSMGCVAFSTANITSPPALTDSIAVTPATCGVCDGAAVVFANGQTPFTFQWSVPAGGGTAPSASSLCSGLYQVVITDGNGCSDTATALLPNTGAPEVTVVATDVSCFGNCNGSATASAAGGALPHNFIWLDASLNTLSSGTAATTINGLCPGNYFVQVQDASLCSTFYGFEIETPDSLVASFNFIQDETCFNSCDGIMSVMPVNGTLPFTYTWPVPAGLSASTATGLCDGVYIVNIADANGCALTLTDTIGQPAAIVMGLDSVDASCSTIADGSIDATVSGGAGGFVYSWTGPSGFTANTEDIDSLFFGTYVLTVTDANGCSLSDTIVVNAALIADANAGPDTVMCANGSTLVLNGIGTTGASYTWTDTTGTLLSSTATLPIPAGTTAGTYIFTVTNAGCVDRDTVNITINPLPQVDAGDDQQLINGQSVSIGGNPSTALGNNITWSPDNNTLSSTAAANPTASPVVTTEYVLQVTDGNGCVAYDTVVVEVLPDIIFPNGFSPNGDGANDTWILDFIEFFPDIEVQVFNRWGQPVFYSKGYDIPWDGTYENKPVTIGTYYYVILLNHPLYPDAFTGPLTILR